MTSNDPPPATRLPAEFQALAHQEARLAERLHSELIAAIAHELRLPLTAIMGYASALLLDEVEWSREKQLEFIRLIVEESEGMQALLADLLDSAVIEGEQFNLQLQEVALAPLARAVADEFQVRTPAHRLLAELPLDFPGVQADPHWIKQVLRNLLDNAIKYSPEGGLVVISGQARAGDVVVRVADQGLGIAPEEIPSLFEKYYRVKTPGGVQVPGTGLGLPIARRIIAAHGGRIWVESLPGQGTTVSFSLPRAEAARSNSQ